MYELFTPRWSKSWLKAAISNASVSRSVNLFCVQRHWSQEKGRQNTGQGVLPWLFSIYSCTSVRAVTETLETLLCGSSSALSFTKSYYKCHWITEKVEMLQNWVFQDQSAGSVGNRTCSASLTAWVQFLVTDSTEENRLPKGGLWPPDMYHDLCAHKYTHMLHNFFKWKKEQSAHPQLMSWILLFCMWNNCNKL